MAAELETLLVRIEANTLQLRRAMNSAEKQVDTFAKRTDRSLRRTEKRFDVFGKSVSTKLGAALGSVLALRFGQRMLEDMANLKVLADVTGVAAEQIQELRFSAAAAGVEVDTFDKSLKRFAGALGEMRAGMGTLDAILKRALPSLRNQLLATKDTTEAFRVFADAVQRMSRGEERAALIKQGFGQRSLALVRILEQGSAGLKSEAAEARTLGAVFGNEGAKNAELFTTELGKLSDAISGQLKESISSTLPFLTRMVVALQSVARFTAKSFNATGTAIDALRSGPGAAARRKEIQQQFMQGEFSGRPTAIEALADVEMAAAKAGSAIKEALRFQLPKGATSEIGEFQTEIITAGADAMQSLRGRYLQESGQTLEAIRLQYETDLAEFRQLLSDKLITQQEFEGARRQLSAISAEQIKAHMADQASEARAALEEVASLIEGEVMGGISDAFRTGELNAKAFFRSMLEGMGKMIIQAQILKPLMQGLTGGLGGSFSSFLGSVASTGLPGLASGGPVMPGKPHIVGEKGPELFVPRVAGTVVPNHKMGSGPTIINNIDARGAEVGVETRIQSALIEAQRAQKSAVAQVNEHRRRFPTAQAA